MRICTKVVFLSGLFADTITEFSTTKFTVNTPTCTTLPSFQYQISSDCESKTYESGQSCGITCNSKVQLTCDCLAELDSGIIFLKTDGCSWSVSEPCQTNVQETNIEVSLQTSASTLSECEIFADAFRASFESDLQSKMGKADTVNSVATKCAEKSSSGARKRRSLTFDVEMDITVVTVLTDQSQSVVTGIEVIQNIVSDSLTKTMSAEIVDFEVVSVELEQKVVEQNSVDEVLVEVDEDDEEATNTISQEQFETLQTQIQTLDEQLSQVLPKIELLEEFNSDSEKMFTSLTNLFESLEEEQNEQKVKTMMNMLANMNSAKRISQVEINSTPGMACTLKTRI